MASPMLKGPLEKDQDIRVSDLGMQRRSARQKLALKNKVSASVLAGVLERSAKLSGSAIPVVKALAKPAKVQQQPVTQPRPQPKVAKSEVKIAAPSIKPTGKRTARVEALLSAPARSLVTSPPTEYTIEGYHTDSREPVGFTAEEVRVELLVRAKLHDHYHCSQNDTPLTATVHKMVKSTSNKKKTRGYVERSVSLQNTLERLATFECSTTLTDDNDQYVARWAYSRNNIIIGGVKFTLGDKRELVAVPETGTTKLEHLSVVKRSQQTSSRTPAGVPAVTQPVVGVVTEPEELPPWDVEDLIAKGYASRAEEYDERPTQRVEYIHKCQALGHNHLYHIVSYPNVDGQYEAAMQARRDRYMNGLASLPMTGHPYYSTADNDEPSPTTPSPSAAAPTGDALNEELRLCFAALRDQDEERHVEGHFHPNTLRWLKAEYGTPYEQWTKAFTARRNKSVLLAQFYTNASARSRQEKLGEKWCRAIAHNDTLTRTALHKARKRATVSIAKKNFHIMEDLRRGREREEGMIKSRIQASLLRLEEKGSSTPRDDEQDHLDRWLFEHADTSYALQLHLQWMDLSDVFMGDRPTLLINHREFKAHSVPRSHSLSTPEDDVHLNLPPPSAPAVATGSVKVGQKQPDFLIAGDVLVPFRRGMSSLPEVLMPSKMSTLVQWAASRLYWVPPMLATG